MLGAMLLSRPKPPQAGPKASLYKGIDPSDHCSPRSVGRPLSLPQPLAVEPNLPPWRAKFTHSKFKRALYDPALGIGEVALCLVRRLDRRPRLACRRAGLVAVRRSGVLGRPRFTGSRQFPRAAGSYGKDIAD